MTYSAGILRTACSAQNVISTPLGRLLLARTPSGLAGAWFEGHAHHPPSSRRRMSPATRCSSASPISSSAISPGSLQAFDIPFVSARHDIPTRGLEGVARDRRRQDEDYGEIAREIGQPVAGARSAPQSAANRSRSGPRATA